MSYSEELTQSIIEEYNAAPSKETVAAIAERIGKPVRSVVSKLSSEGVYQTPQRTTKTGEPIVKKEELVADIGEWLEIEVPTLAKAGKQDLKKLHDTLREIFVDD